MKWLSFVGRNLLGLSALLLAHNFVDQYILHGGTDWTDYAPYLFLVLMYGWIVFHNRVLFERLFLGGNRVAYFGWLGLCMLVGTVNMTLILRQLFGVDNVVPHLLRYYSDTVTGLGVYVTYRYLTTTSANPPASIAPQTPLPTEPTYLSCLVNGVPQQIPVVTIRYVEGLENYIKIFMAGQMHVVRMTLKEAELRLPKDQFVRISKSHIVNLTQAQRLDADHVQVGAQTLRIGRVFKRYTAEQLP
ncbi:LytR/AlgR family response regulator transcription factor [Fibrella aquatilis]|uniref:LytTR family transcriptional regulator n=1 Tax=Fibrella aquatilis TaxID=2817059 RepID=A0A939GCE7_9BACT|nr:LytTR family DNA-binding domain-containing protein [Fibrella aquatilis]MBO0934022.1 LytTR family transcriptional regulator [Fibrella aquatilis]